MASCPARTLTPAPNCPLTHVHLYHRARQAQANCVAIGLQQLAAIGQLWKPSVSTEVTEEVVPRLLSSLEGATFWLGATYQSQGVGFEFFDRSLGASLLDIFWDQSTVGLDDDGKGCVILKPSGSAAQVSVVPCADLTRSVCEFQLAPLPPLPPPSSPPSPPPSPPGFAINATFVLEMSRADFEAQEDEFETELATFLALETALVEVIDVVDLDTEVRATRTGSFEDGEQARRALQLASIQVTVRVWEPDSSGEPVRAKIRQTGLTTLSQVLRVTVLAPVSLSSDEPYSPPPPSTDPGLPNDPSTPRESSQVSVVQSQLQIGAIVGGGAGGLVAIGAVICLALQLRRRRRDRRADEEMIDAALDSNKSFKYSMHIVRATDFVRMSHLQIFETVRLQNQHVAIDKVEEARERFMSPTSKEQLIFISHRVSRSALAMRPPPGCCFLCLSTYYLRPDLPAPFFHHRN
jgi:hypothetical protein